MCDKERDHMMIIHAHEYPPLPAAPFPCEYTFYLLIIVFPASLGHYWKNSE